MRCHRNGGKFRSCFKDKEFALLLLHWTSSCKNNSDHMHTNFNVDTNFLCITRNTDCCLNRSVSVS